MSTPIPSVLRECHRLRRLLRDLQGEIDLGPRVVKAQQARLAQEEQTHKDAYEFLKKLKLKLKDDEGSLKTIETQLSKLQTRSLEVTTMREMDATKSEIAQANEKKGMFEDSILSSMTQIEERTKNLANVDQRWADAQKEFAEQQAEAKERLERLKNELKAANEELQKVEATLPANIKPSYLSLIKSHGPEGLAAVKDKVCQSCRSTLTAQRLIEIQGGAFQMCSNCGRALYPAE